MTKRIGIIALATAALLLGSACSSDDTASSTDATTPASPVAPGTTNPADNAPTDPFYIPPTPLPDGQPGDIIRSEPLDGAPDGSSAWRVLYLSTGLQEQPIAVSGVIIVPSATPGTSPGTTPGTMASGERPILSWAHPTTGVVDACAPSTMSDVFTLIPGLADMLSAGYVVAATDYESLGTPGVHPYLIGESEGRSVLDAARAARNLPEAGAGEELLLFGHSQGGQASLFAGQLAPDYAPELDLRAVAAAAPAGELAELLTLDANTVEDVILGSYAVNAFEAIYGPAYPDLDVSDVVTPEGQAVIDEIVELCDLTQFAELEAIAGPITGKFLVEGATESEPWATLLAENSPGGTRIAVPVLITQGEADTLVVPSTTAGLVSTYCDNGTNVAEKTYPGVTHTLIGYESVGDVLAWMAGILSGDEPQSTC